MDQYANVINDVNKGLLDWQFPSAGNSFSEDFAIKRFLKKLERPDSSKAALRKKATIKKFFDIDEQLATHVSNITRVQGGDNGEFNSFYRLSSWVDIRRSFKRVLRKYRRYFYRFDDYRAPVGSSFVPTKGCNSFEARMSGCWTCTRSNFVHFARLSYNCRELRIATRMRWYKRLLKAGIRPRKQLALIWREFCAKQLGFFVPYSKTMSNDTIKQRYRVFLHIKMLLATVSFVRGARLTTVPKNNEIDRCINVESFGNVLTQSTIGLALRKVLLAEWGINLDTLAEIHRERIADPSIATIDLSSASDRFSWRFIEWLTPDWFWKLLNETRSTCVWSQYGPDATCQSLHRLEKVSSMGNGFTFELLSIILTCVCKQYDKNATVFGDDIIISTSAVEQLFLALQQCGHVVNEDKSFWEGKFRESCGANYHQDEGYIPSYDFKWSTNMVELTATLNKLAVLGQYYDSFRLLWLSLLCKIRPALQGPPFQTVCWDNRTSKDLHGTPRPVLLPDYIWSDGLGDYGEAFRTDNNGDCVQYLVNLQHGISAVRVCRSFVVRKKLRTPVLRDEIVPSEWWAKLLAYLKANIAARDEAGSGKVICKRFVYVEGVQIALPLKAEQTA